MEKDMGAIPGSREPDPASGSGPSGFDPARIPAGYYCYASLDSMDENGVMRIKGMCPYWEPRDGDNAYCRFLDYETETERELLWDQVKVCGVNAGPQDIAQESTPSSDMGKG